MILQHWTASFRKNAAPPYQRRQPQRLWYLGIDALLSIFLVMGIFQFSQSHLGDGLHERQLEHAGAIAMSSARIIEHIRYEGRSAYWLGPQNMAKYATDDMLPQVLTIIYLPSGVNLFASDEPKMTVRTFDDLATFEKVGHVYLDPDSTSHVLSKGGNTVIFDARNMTSEIVLRSNIPEIIEINYTHTLTEEEMLTNADSLRLVW